jgi:DNA-nicking Smr family endonuclease
MHDEDHDQNFEPVQIPINGALDLHTFNPHDVKELLPHYLDECRKRGIFEIRIIHGKGTGTLRNTVHAILERLPGVTSYKLSGGDAGGWGATLVKLKTR